jgi:hypothetical protein
MMHRRLGGCRAYTCAVLFAVSLLTGAAGGGCSGGFVAPNGSGATDGGSDAMGGCTAAQCAGLAAPALAKMCPDGTSVGPTFCERQASGQCNWGFPACPGDAGQACPGLGCFPQCPSGVLKDSNGCDTCQCAPVADAGATGACTNSADCGSGRICGFLESAGCTATGSCFPAPGVTCNVVLLACACDGTDMNVACTGLPGDYAPKPYAHSGACGPDSGGGGKDAGTLACGPYSCDVATEFCYEAGGGAVLPDAGSNFTYACNPIPAQCRAAPTCACIVAADAGTHGCPCSVQAGGALLAACLYP